MPRVAVHPFRDFPLGSLDTDRDPPHMPPVASSISPPVDMTSVAGHHSPERTKYQPRRRSALVYQSSDTRDLREHGYSRSSRHLVVVIPPPDLPLDRGPLGNVLSIGPRHRLSQGILMPLFPSMFGQLSAIAREYNFPSTVGLYLYLHVNENGKTMTPRIPDDAWQYLFGHLSDGRPPSGDHRLPIGGSIEFDIDLNKARWFDAWVSGNLWDSSQILPPVVTPLSFLEVHQRGESQTTNVDEQPVEDRLNASVSHAVVANSQPETLRHLPKKLSLVDKFELHGVHLPSGLSDYPEYPASSATRGTYASSPILQPANPEVTESDLERRVNSWRTTTDSYPFPMVETYQPVTEVRMPVAMDEYVPERNFQQALNIDEFPLSVTSVGPRSPALQSSLASSRPSSVHLDRRVNGSVPLTPTTMTSWGPMDDEWHSILSDVTRLPTPDIGERVIEDVMVPRPRAVWGNSFGWRSAVTWKQVYPYSLFQVKPTVWVHLQDTVPQYPTLVIYPPTTPQFVDLSMSLKSSPKSVWGSSFGWQKTVTWRKPYPYTTMMIQPRAPAQFFGASGLEPRYPNLHIYPAVYPYFEIYPTGIVDEDVSQPVSVMLNGSSSFLAYYPNLVIYPAEYPCLEKAIGELKTEARDQPNINTYSPNSVSLYPNLVIYPAVYPYFNLYPNVLRISDMLKQEIDMGLVNARRSTAEYPNMAIYPGAYSYPETYATRDVRQASSAAWGISFGWLTAKTWLQVYPLHTAAPLATRRRVDNQSRFISKPGSVDTVVSKHAVWGSSFGWEIAATWRAVWPTSHARSLLNTSPMSVQLGHSSLNYPSLIIYPPAYPHIDIYPPCASVTSVEGFRPTRETQFTVDMVAHYPNLVMYPAIYPHFDLYPASAETLVAVESEETETTAQVGLVELPASNYVWKAEERYSETGSIEDLPSPDLRQRAPDRIVTIKPGFPHRPWHMVWPFFGHVGQVQTLPFKQSVFVSESLRPVIHPQAYPYFELYPTLVNEPETLETLVNPNIYPYLDIYPAVYPHFNIYPAIDLQVENPNKIVSNIQHERVEVKLASVYPNLDIYCACYPYNLDNIYPFINATESTQVPFEAFHGYPWLDIYPPVYPFIQPYPSISDSVCLPGALDEAEYNTAKVSLAPSKLNSGVTGSVVYPYFDLYPAAPASAPQQVQDACADDLSTPPYTHSAWSQQKTHVELHATLFLPLGKLPAQSTKTHRQLHTEVFQGGVVWSPSGYDQDLSSLMTRRLPDVPVSEPLPHNLPRDTSTLHPSRSRSGTTTSPTQDRTPFPLVLSPILPPLRVRSPGVPSQPCPAVSETFTPRLPSPTSTYAHMRTTSARFSQAVKSMMPRGQRRSSNAALVSPPSEDHKERAKSPTRLLSLVDRRTTTSPHTHTSEFLTRAPRSPQAKESFVLQRARAYEQATAANQPSGIAAANGTHSPFILPPSPQMPPMSGITETIEQSKTTFP